MADLFHNAFLGTETLAAIIPSVINTTVNALSRFLPNRRKCYRDNEFDLPNLRYSDGYRYSHTNCLYQAVIEKIMKNCSCRPSFTKHREGTDIGLCRGKQLNCALWWLSMMGNENNPGLNFSNNFYARYTKQLGQWYSTGVPRHSCVP